jgi:predicted DNA-binding antitoxin AbrB/MazE fold protein
MTETVKAVYENGVLRPLRPLKLRERQTVRLQIVQEVTDSEDEVALRMLIEAGALTPPPGRSDVEPISEQERRELADRLGRAPGKPLSEIIIEDRGERSAHWQPQPLPLIPLLYLHDHRKRIIAIKNRVFSSKIRFFSRRK